MQLDHNPLTHYDASFTGFIGVSQEDITPPLAVYSRNWGAAENDVAEGIHKPLKLTCITFQISKSDKPLVLISADLGWWKSAEDERNLRYSILKEIDLEPSHLMFCLSHTHAGPSLFSEDASKPGGEHIKSYLHQLKKKVLSAVSNAQLSSSISTLSWRYGKCNLATNRDLQESKTKRFIVGFNPEEPADDTLLVGRITNEQEKITGVIVNYACHPTTLAWNNRFISPDYIGAMRELVEQSTCSSCLFLQGASGDLAPVEQYTSDYQLADAYGRQLGYAVLSTIEAMRPPKTQLEFSHVVESGAPLAIWKRRMQHPSATLLVETVEIDMILKPLPSLSEIERQLHDCEDRVLKERLWRLRGVRKTVGNGATSKMPVWLWCLGDALLVGQPNEAYSEFQQKIRQHLSPHPVAAINIVNGYAGYLPPKRMYSNDMYAVRQTPFAAGSLELLTETAINSAKKIMITS